MQKARSDLAFLLLQDVYWHNRCTLLLCHFKFSAESLLLQTFPLVLWVSYNFSSGYSLCSEQWLKHSQFISLPSIPFPCCLKIRMKQKGSFKHLLADERSWSCHQGQHRVQGQIFFLYVKYIYMKQLLIINKGKGKGRKAWDWWIV